MHWAAKQNHADLVRFLLDKGASKYIKTNDGKLAGNLSTDPAIRSILDAGLSYLNQQVWLLIDRFRKYQCLKAFFFN